MQWVKRIAVVTLLVHLILRGDMLLPVAVWDGSFPLTVHVSVTDAEAVSIACDVFQRRDYADFAAQDSQLIEFRDWRAVKIEEFDGKPFEISVPVSGRTSLCGRDISRTQFQYLAVVAELADGKRISKIVEIPDGRVTRNVRVSLP
jgi:hypothetical protein